MDTLLERLNIYGIPQTCEDAILACLLQGDPGLLIGPPGTAKTELLEKIGEAFRERDKALMPTQPDQWFDFQVYDTSKLNPEDLVGFPNPKALMDGKMEYVKLPSTVWGKKMVVWDEINRCEKSRQSNLFEIIRSRRVNGMPTGNMFMFSAMNPLGDTGTQEMSEALTDRHVFYIYFSKFENMTEENKNKIINRVGSHESVGLRHWGNKTFELDTNDDMVNPKLASIGTDLTTILTEAAGIYENLNNEIGDKITKLIIRVLSGIEDEKKKKDSNIAQIEISGRRGNMMLKGLLAIRAIQLAKSKIFECPIPSLEATLCNATTMCLPIGIGQKATQDSIHRLFTLVQEIVKTQYSVLFDNATNADKIYQIFFDKNPLTRLESILSIDSMTKLTEHKVWSDLYSMCKDSELEAILGILHSSYGILPSSININAKIVQAEKNRKDFVINAPYSDHKAFMASVKQKVASNKVLDFCVSRAFLYLNKHGNKHSHAEVINNLHSVDKLAMTLKNKLDKKPQNVEQTEATEATV